MHLFLTGDRGVGKTTVVTKIVNTLTRSGTLSADEIAGFRTVWATPRGASNGCAALYIIPYTPEDDPPERHGGVSDMNARIPPDARPVAERDGGNHVVTIRHEVFDEDGAAMLQAATPTPKLIIMDELGFMEMKANAFKNAVMRVLDADVRTLGVMRKEGNPFLDAIRDHPKVSVMKVDTFNRDALPTRLTSSFFHD
jgi:nucleoside-triphosphatase THEP1